MLNIEEIEQRLAKATPRAEWLAAIDTTDDGCAAVYDDEMLVAEVYDACGNRNDNAALIANAPTDIAALLSELKSLRAENARLREATDTLCAYYAERQRAGDKEPMQVTNFRRAASVLGERG